MLNSSSNRVRFHRSPTRVALAVEDRVGPRLAGSNRIDIKELQRRAFERGVAVERDKHGALLAQLAERVQALADADEANHARERARLESFAVELACVVAQRLTHAVIDEGSHDVLAMVSEAMAEIEATRPRGKLSIHLNPDDHAELLRALAERGEDLGERVDSIVADAAVDRASFRIDGEETSYWGDVQERLEELRRRLLERSARVQV